MRKIFVDTNLLMEIMMGRSKMEQVAKVMHTKEYEFFISTLTVHILFYFAEIESIDRDFTRGLTKLGHHLLLSPAMVATAHKRYSGKDFEDCLQAACAELGGCDEIITLDKKFAKNSGTKLPVRVIA